MKTLQSLQGQLLGFHFSIIYLNPVRNLIAFISEGINSRISGPKYGADPIRIHYRHCGFDTS